MVKDGWVLCPNCNSKTRLKVTDKTVIFDLPLFCPKCKHVTNINLKNNIISETQDAVLTRGNHYAIEKRLEIK